MAPLRPGRALSEEEAYVVGVLGGNPESVVDAFAWTALGLVCGLSLLVYAAQKLQARRLSGAPPGKDGGGGEARTPLWVLASFALCYGLLIPGLFSALFSYDLSGVNGVVGMRHSTETMVSFVLELWKDQAYLGAALVVLYAMVIPAVKLAMLVLGELWRRGTPAQVMRARRCVHLLQSISKWASPDMFAYVLLLYLLRALHHPPTMCALAELDVGFACFSIFCVGSTVAALGLRMPPLPEGAEAARPRCCARVSRWPAALAGLVALLFCAFVPLLILGLSRPSMSLRVDPEGFFEPSGPLSPMLRPVIMSMGIEELARAQVSIWQCLGELAAWTRDGEATGFIGFVLFAIFAIAATVVDMLLLLAAAVTRWRRAAHPAGDAEPLRLVRIARVLKKLSFLDVAIVGIVVLVVGAQAYRSQGLILSMEAGLVPLLGAEVCHYLAHYLVADSRPSDPDAARSVRPKEVEAEEEGEAAKEGEAAEVVVAVWELGEDPEVMAV